MVLYMYTTHCQKHGTECDQDFQDKIPLYILLPLSVAAAKDDS